jgi:hypothetical protein
MTLGFSYSNYNRGHRSNETLVINFLKNLMAGWSDKVCNALLIKVSVQELIRM